MHATSKIPDLLEKTQSTAVSLTQLTVVGSKKPGIIASTGGKMITKIENSRNPIKVHK
jgi:hypothetical protein